MKSKIYRDLTPKKLTEVTIDDIDQLRASMFAQGRKNKVAYDELRQVAVAANQQGGTGSVPGTSTIVQTANIYDNKSNLYQPDIGVWILEALSFANTTGNGYTYQVFLEHTNGGSIEIVNTQNPYTRPIIEIDENITVQVQITGGSGIPASTTATAYLMRRR